MAKRYVPDASDIVWLNFTPHAGREQAGHRPIVVTVTDEDGSGGALAIGVGDRVNNNWVIVGAMLEEIKRALQRFAEDHPEVLGIFLFGSYAQRRAREKSDVDVAVYVEPDVDDVSALDSRLKYTVELETVLNKRVDLVLLNQAPPILRHQVFRRGILVYERDPLRVRRFIGEALVEFYDEIVTLEAAQKTLIRRRLLGR